MYVHYAGQLRKGKKMVDDKSPSWKPFHAIDLSDKPAFEEEDTIDFLCKSIKRPKASFGKDIIPFSISVPIILYN